MKLSVKLIEISKIFCYLAEKISFDTETKRSFETEMFLTFHVVTGKEVRALS